jgi:[ribosomal protein S5]-alanine N-acetyltransferase
MTRKTYRTSRLVVRPFKASDYETWARFIAESRPRKNRFDWERTSEFRTSRTAFLKKINHSKKSAADDEMYFWAIFRRRERDLIGFVDIYVLARKSLHFANLGYRIDNRFWGRGYGKEALSRMIPAALRDLKLNRLEAVIDLGNRRSTAVARAAGMKREGVRRRYYYQDRHWADQVVYVSDRKGAGLPVLHPT